MFGLFIVLAFVGLSGIGAYVTGVYGRRTRRSASLVARISVYRAASQHDLWIARNKARIDAEWARQLVRMDEFLQVSHDYVASLYRCS